jgi:hypothetical protein
MLTDDLSAFVASGLSIYVATRDAKLEPDGTRAWALSVEDDREHVVVYVHEGVAGPILRNLEDNGEVALAVSRPTDHRSCQLKGRYVESHRCRPEERDEIERQADGFLGELESIGMPRALMAREQMWPCVAIRVRVGCVYEQTPGPGAGDPLP